MNPIECIQRWLNNYGILPINKGAPIKEEQPTWAKPAETMIQDPKMNIEKVWINHKVPD